MLLTNIMLVCEGKKAPLSFENHQELYDYMITHDIPSCSTSATIAGVEVMPPITVTPEDLQKIL